MFPLFPMMKGFQNKALSQNMKPVRLYRLLQSICNFEADEYTPTKDLAKIGRTKIFDFDYPLSQKVSRETFEVNILEHFMNRRIGFETPTAFKISLKAKLNEIMPSYNKMFDMLDGWDLFNDGETINKTTTIEYDETGDYEKTNTGTDNISNTGTNTVNNTGTNTVTNTGTDTTVNTGSDTNVESGRIDTIDKNSDMPQSDLDNVQDDDYLTNYKINEKTFNNHQNQRTLNLQNQETLNLQNQETINTQNRQTLNTQNLRTANLKENNEHNKNIDECITETETHTEKDKIKIYKEFLENRTSIYTMIYDDLETCFYGLL